MNFLRSLSFWKIWWIALTIKIVFAICIPLSNDEAYYWVWGHFPQWSYFDHPAMVGWLFFLGRIFEGFGSGVRIPGVIVGHLTLLIWNSLLTPILNEDKKRFWLFFVLFSPFLGVGSLIITPDIPLLFFWSLALWFFTRLLLSGERNDYLALGAALGLGFCGKYTVVLFVPIALIYLVASGAWRKIHWPYVPLTILTGLVCSFPVLYWNWQHDWASFAFQLHHGFDTNHQHASAILEYVGSQIALLFPTVIWFAVKRGTPKEVQLLHYFGWGPIAFFLYSSLHAPVEANWPLVAYPAIMALAVFHAQNLKPLKITIGVWAFALLLVLSQVAFPWIPIDPKKLKTSEFHRFDMYLPIARRQNDVYFGSYQMAAAVSFGTKKQFLKLGGMNRRDFYDFLPQAYPDRDRFWIGKEILHPLPKWVEDAYKVVGSTHLSDEYEIVEVVRKK